ncbi:unnamed protein product [Candidula unifasciata]|uniref:Uncharacterized protein n=1 Tax=Candidula unifasciata TaxID=100452 RepID=A0A8S3Z5J7_9EUPU|nr:unnamed protein product [Candidula unifasciata]
MRSSLFLACLAVAVAVPSSALSSTLQKYLCFYNGKFTNKQFLEQNPDSGATKVETRVTSVYLNNISQNPFTYVEQSDNGELVLAELGEVTEGPNERIEVTTYNLTNYIGKKLGEIEINDFRNLTRDQLHGNPGCGGSLQLVDDSRFEGDLPDCRHISSSGLRRDYTASLTCDTIIVGIPRGAAETAPNGEMTLKLEGAKFPLPDGSSCTCGNTSS